MLPLSSIGVDILSIHDESICTDYPRSCVGVAVDVFFVDKIRHFHSLAQLTLAGGLFSVGSLFASASRGDHTRMQSILQSGCKYMFNQISRIIPVHMMRKYRPVLAIS